MPAQRKPLTIPLVSRDSTAAKDGRLTNAYSENGPIGPMVVKRAGTTVQNALGAGCAQGAFTYNGEALFIKSDTLYSNLVPYSTGTSWTASTAPPKPTAGDIAGSTKPGYMVSHGGNLYHIGGKNAADTNISVYKSTDNGATWTTILTTAPFVGSLLILNNAAVSFNGRIYVLLTDKSIWSSADGVSWVQNTSDATGGDSTRDGFALIVHDGLLYALFSRAATTTYSLWRSANGSSWSSVNGSISTVSMTDNSGFVSLNGILFLIAGMTTGPAALDDVYKSIDNGVTWSLATNAPGFATRRYPSAVVYNSKIWVMGGANSGLTATHTAEVWSSTDGITWSLVVASAGWSERYAASIAIHNNTIYIGPGLGRSGGNTVAVSSLHFSAIGGATSTALTSPTQNCLPVQVGQIPANGAIVAKAFIKSTKDAWVWDGTSITKVSDADYPATTVFGVAYLDGTIYVMDSKGVIYGSDLLAPTAWSALNFITANKYPDAGVAIIEHLDNIFAIKETSIEVFYDAANPTGSPLAKVPHAVMTIGCAIASSIAVNEQSVFLMSQSKQQKGRSVTKITGTNPQRISTPWVDRILNADSLATVYTFIIGIDGHVFYFLTLKASAITLVYDDTMNEWHTATKLTAFPAATVSTIAVQSDGSILVTMPLAHGASDGDPVVIAGATPSAANGSFNLRYDTSVHAATQFSYTPDSAVSGSITGTVTATLYQSSYFPGAYSARSSTADLVLDEATGDIYKIDPAVYQDNSAPIDVHIRTEREDFGTINPKTYNSLALVGDNVSSKCAVRYCNDDYSTFSKYRLVDLSKKRPRLTQLGSAERRAWEFRHTGNTAFRLQAAEPDIDGWNR